MVEDRHYAPFGEIASATGGITPVETIGFIGERYDADAGLQYLNARYYDPRLGLFIQPDWFEVTDSGVGTNRYSYSFNDPVNNLDRTGNACVPCVPVVLSALEALIAAVTIGTAADLLDNGVADGSVGTGLGAATQDVVGDIVRGEVISPIQQSTSGHNNGPPLEGETQSSEVVPAQGTNNNGTAKRPTFMGEPGTAQAGSFQDRIYGPGGQPQTDIDWDQDHEGAGRPHAHDWVDGNRVSPGKQPTAEERALTEGRRDLATGRLQDE